jgi:hypothetical protein
LGLRPRLLNRKKIHAIIANTAAAPTAPPAITPACDDEVPVAVGAFVTEIADALPVSVLAELPMTVGVFA